MRPRRAPLWAAAALVAVPTMLAAVDDPAAVSAAVEQSTCTCSTEPAYRVCVVERPGLRHPRRRVEVDAETYVGWRAYGTFCRVCHADDSHGAGSAPDLMAAMRRLDRARFARVVAEGRNAMPAWAGNPLVRNEYDALYTYLRARARGDLDYVPGQRLRLLREQPDCEPATAPRGADSGGVGD